MIAHRPDWTLSRQRQWGVPMPFFVDRETDALHPDTLALLELAASKVEHGGIEAWFEADVRGLRRRREEVPQAHRHARRVVRLGRDAPDRDGRPRRRSKTRMGSHSQWTRLPGGPLSRRLGPASRLVPFVAARLVHAERRAAVQGAADARLRRRRRRQEDVEVEGQRRRAAEGGRHARRRDPAAVGRGDRLLGRALHLRRDPEARRRKLSPHPQHAALPAREHVRFRCRAATRCRSASCSRSTATRSRRRRRWPTAVEADYARYEFHLVVQRLQTYCSEDLGGFYLDVLKDRLYTAAHGQPRAPLGADGARADPRRAAEADGADPVVHRRGGVARPAAGRRRRSSRTCGRTACRRWPDEPALIAKWERILAVRAAVLKELETRARTARSARRCRRRSRSPRRPPTTKRSRRSATTCAS